MFARRVERYSQKLRFILGTKYSKCFSFKSRHGGYRQIFHRGTAADRSVLKGIFLKNQYSLKTLRRGEDLLARYHDIVTAGQIPLIIDAGANLGGSAIWFLDTFEKAHVVAIEPDPENIAFLRKNTTGLDVDVYEAAIGSTDGQVLLFDPGNGACGYQTEESEEGSCKRISISRIIKEKITAGYVPFIIKIDIEGGEENLFATDCEWIESCPLLIIELHDWLFSGSARSSNFLKAISAHKRDFVHIGENIFSIKNP